jgi:hypothetical protein
MAHTCPECGSICYCGGDIDDAEIPDDEAEENCTCCLDDSDDGDDYDDLDDSEDTD